MHRSLPAEHDRAAATVCLDLSSLARWQLPVDEHGDKVSRGTVLVIGGATTTPGAVLLAGEAALRIGAGRLQIATVAPVATAIAVAMPEAMVVPLRTDDGGRIESHHLLEDLGEALAGADAVLLGCGLLPDTDTDALLDGIVDGCGPTTRVVIDAAATSSIGSDGTRALAAIGGRVALTPNRAELDAIVGRQWGHDDLPPDVTDDPVAAVARRFAAAVTSFGRVATGDGRRWSTSPATPGLGTSGSGDVLAGLVAGACARTDDIARAICWATFVHEEAGNRLSDRVGRLSFLARDLVAEVPAVMASVERSVTAGRVAPHQLATTPAALPSASGQDP